MIKHLVVLVLVALAVPAPAQAKEPLTIAVCGESGCSAASSPFVDENPFPGSGGGTSAAAPPGPYYRLELDAGGESWSIFYVPAARALAIPDDRGWIDWQPFAGPGARVVRRLARGIEPFARPTVSEALLDARPLRGDPQSYLGLLSLRGAPDLPDGESVSLELRSDQSSPWTNIGFRYYPDDVVFLGATGAFVHVPPGLVADLAASLVQRAAGSPSAPPGARSDTTGFPWLWLALGVGGVGLAVTIGTLRARARRSAPRRPTTA